MYKILHTTIIIQHVVRPAWVLSIHWKLTKHKSPVFICMAVSCKGLEYPESEK